MDISYNEPKKVRITVEKIPSEGVDPCPFFKEGDYFDVGFELCPSGFCAAAFHTLWPHLRVLELGGRHPWDYKPGETTVCCPHPERSVIFKISTIE